MSIMDVQVGEQVVAAQEVEQLLMQDRLIACTSQPCTMNRGS